VTACDTNSLTQLSRGLTTLSTNPTLSRSPAHHCSSQAVALASEFLPQDSSRDVRSRGRGGVADNVPRYPVALSRGRVTAGALLGSVHRGR
jgi:hypothetical protein